MRRGTEFGVATLSIAALLAAACVESEDPGVPDAADAATPPDALTSAPPQDASPAGQDDADAGVDADAARGPLGDGGFERVVSGSHHACVLQADASLVCWGYNHHGQLGIGTKTNKEIPTLVPSLGAVAEVALGGLFSCARTTAGEVFCWGNLVDDTNTPVEYATPQHVAGAADVVQIGASSSGYHACARTAAGEVLCWGAGGLGQLGDGTASHSAARRVPALSGVAEIAVAADHTCARKTDGRVLCWGYNDRGQIGDTTRMSRSAPTATVPPLADVEKLTAGGSQTCARTTNGDLLCWGANSGGELGDGTKTTRLTPTKIPALAGVAEVALAVGYGCARKADGTVLCWGEGYLGDGSPSPTQQPSPRAVPGLAGVLELAVGASVTYARMPGRAVLCWGRNDSLQCYDGVFGGPTWRTVIPSPSAVVL